LAYEQTPNTDTGDSVEDIGSDGLSIGDGLFDFEQEDSLLGKDTTYNASNSHDKTSDNKDDHQVEEDTYQVDKIIAGPKIVNGVMSVRVSWLPSGKKVWDPTWEPLDNIKNDVPIEWSKYMDSRKEKELNKKKKEEVKINKECKHCRMPVVQDEVACHKCKHIIHSQCGFNDGGTVTCCNCLDTSSLTKFRQTYVCPSAHNLSQYDPQTEAWRGLGLTCSTEGCDVHWRAGVHVCSAYEPGWFCKVIHCIQAKCNTCMIKERAKAGRGKRSAGNIH